MVVVLAFALVVGSSPRTVDAAATSSVAVSGGVLTFTAGAGGANDVNVTLAGGTYSITDSIGAMTAGAGCSTASSTQINCSATGVTSVRLIGLDGNDTLRNSSATVSTIEGGDGNDTLYGGTGVDTLSGGNDNDLLDGGTGADPLNGGAGTDTATYSSRTAAVTVTINGTANDGVSGEADNVATDVENLVGGTANDSLTGSAGNNTLNGGPGNDVLNGSTGVDTLDYSTATSAVTLRMATTSSQVTGGAGSDTQSNNENLIGSAFNDTLTGTTGSNTIWGGPGNDTIDGNTGSDVMWGGDGTDTATYAARTSTVLASLDGVANDGSSPSTDNIQTDIENITTGSGADTLIGNSQNNVLNGGSGTDTVSFATAPSAVTFSLAITTAQNTVGAGTDTVTAVENLIGSAYDDTLSGNTAANSINGGAGDDLLDGNTGADPLAGGTGVDTVTYASRTATVTVTINGTANDGVSSEADNVATDVENVTTGSGNDSITGSASNNVLNGRAGNDTLNGSGGVDTVSYSDATAAVTVNLALTTAQVTGGSGSDTHANNENLIGSAFNDTLTGNTLNNAIDGLAGNDLIDGSSGADTLTGGIGVDTVNGSAGADTIEIRDGVADTANCGTESDTVTADVVDSVTGCETVSTPQPAQITDGPADGATIGTTTAVYFFSSAAPATFECKVDGAPFSACAVPYTTPALTDGLHTFSVRALGPDADPTPASRTVIVDTTPPDTTITSGPAAGSTTNNPNPVFGFSSEPGAWFDCRVDGQAWFYCASPRMVGAFSDGPHTFEVRASDAVGNVDASPASRTFNVDITPPAPPAITSHVDDQTIPTTTPTISGTAEPGATVDVYENSALLVSTVADENGLWSVVLDELTLAYHPISAKAIDTAGNEGARSEVVSIFPDIEPPTVSIVNPTQGQVVGSADVQIWLLIADNNFWTSTTCSHDGAAAVPCAGAFVIGPLADGPHSLLVTTVDRAGNAASASVDYATDTTPPDTAIADGPAQGSTITNPVSTFTFSSEPGATFECRVDVGAFQPCENPFTTTSLTDGYHDIDVRARDVAGNADPSPVTRTWRVDATAPQISVSYPYDGDLLNNNDVTVNFSVTDMTSTSTTCALDGATPVSCTNQFAISDASEGSHTVVITATDAAGNIGTRSITFSVDTVPPETVYESGPTDGSVISDSTPTFTYSSEATAQLFCSIDNGGWTYCPSPHTTAVLSEGIHNFRAYSMDAANNGDPSPIEIDFTVDTQAPAPPNLTVYPEEDPSPVTAPTFAFTGESGGLFECRLDGETYETCTSPKDYVDLEDGPHVFSVRQRDEAGNVGEPQVFNWTIDHTINMCIDPTQRVPKVVT